MSTVTCDFAAVGAAMGVAEWHDLPFGVKMKIRPQTGLLEASINAQLARDLGAFQRGEDIISRYGFEMEEAGLLADEDVASGFAGLLQTCIRAQVLVEEWNLVDAKGEPIPIEPTTVRLLFHLGPVPGAGPILMTAFHRLCDLPAARRTAEKKGSAASRSGATAAAANTAGRAGTAATRAPSAARSTASAARKTKTSRKPPKGS